MPTPVTLVPAPAGLVSPRPVTPAGQPWFTSQLIRRWGLGKASHAASNVRASGLNLWAFALATVTWVITMLRQIPCRQSLASVLIDTYAPMCYTDIEILYRVRGQAEGLSLYLDIPWEYPVLSGAFAEIARRLTDLLGFTAGPGLDAQVALTNAHVYFAVNAIGLFICFLGVVAIQRRLMGNHPWAVAAVAAAPAVMTTGLINWDLFAVLLCMLGLLMYTRDKPYWAGIWLGLGIAAKLYPLVILGGIFALCLRRRQLVFFLKIFTAAVSAWFLVNLPLMITDFGAFAHFYTFNQARPEDLGSLWLALRQIGLMPDHPQTWALVLMLLSYAFIALITLLAPIRPRVGQVAYLCVAVMVAFNLVYSPQYVLWTLPLIIWARPAWRDIGLYVGAELCYFVCCWLYLDNSLPMPGGVPVVYALAIIIRVIVTLWLMARVVSDILHPADDPSYEERLSLVTTGPVITRDPVATAGAGFYYLPSDESGQPSPFFGDQTNAAGTGVDSNRIPLTVGAGVDTSRIPVAAGAGPLFEPKLAPWLAGIVFVGSRLFLFLAAWTVAQGDGSSVFDVMVKWDAQLFADLAQSGYPEGDIIAGTGDFTKGALFPGLPLLLAGLHALGLSFGLAGCLLSLAGAGLAAWALYRLANGGVAGALTVAAWSLAPMAVFSFVGYTESIFLAAALWAWLAARRDRWWLVGLLAAVACGLRISGLFLVLALVVYAIFGYDQPARRLAQIRRRVAWLVLPLLTLGTYAAFLKLKYGTWTAWYSAQSSGWGRDLHWPWEALRTTLCAAYLGDCSAAHPEVNLWIFRAELVAVAAGIAVLVIMIWRHRWPETTWLGINLAAFTCQPWFMSVARGSLLWFPLWLLIGRIGAAKLSGGWWWARLVLVVGGLFLSTALMVTWAVRFYHGAWSG